MTVRKLPFRAGNEISQTYNSGILTIYHVSDQGEPGFAPVPRIGRVAVLRYEELRLGLNRYYAAKQNQVQAEKVVRIPKISGISPQDVAETEDGRRYRIDLVQLAQSVYPPSLDLTLAKTEPIYFSEESGDEMV